MLLVSHPHVSRCLTILLVGVFVVSFVSIRIMAGVGIPVITVIVVVVVSISVVIMSISVVIMVPMATSALLRNVLNVVTR